MRQQQMVEKLVLFNVSHNVPTSTSTTQLLLTVEYIMNCLASSQKRVNHNVLIHRAGLMPGGKQ